jgi:dTDP-4-dehydrorhamnose reductase
MEKDKQKVLILGASGMLGSGIYSVLKDKYDLILSFHDLKQAKLLESKYADIAGHKTVEFDLKMLYQDFVQKLGHKSPYLNNFLKSVGDVDYIINAIGVITPHSLIDPAMTFFINSAFPHVLANTFGSKLIHITTDCAFNGEDGFPYNENSLKTPIDIYGMSKVLGEPTNCLTLRTSIIGRELGGFKGLLEWFLQQKGKTINGFTQHFWNGVTTKEFGNICSKIFEERNKYPETGIYHIFSTTLSKYDMLIKFKEKYNIDCEIIPDGAHGVNRTLSTIYPLCSKLGIPSFDEMLESL